MKKLLAIMVLGLLWCNFSVAEIISLKKCWPTDARYDFDAKGFKYKNFEDMAKRRGIEEYMFTLDTVAYTITRTYVHTDEYIKKVDWNPDKYNKEIYQITDLGGDVITAELNIPVKAFKLEDKLDVNLLTGKVYSTMVNVRDNKVRTSRIEWSCNKSNEGKDGKSGSSSTVLTNDQKEMYEGCVEDSTHLKENRAKQYCKCITIMITDKYSMDEILRIAELSVYQQIEKYSFVVNYCNVNANAP